MKFRTRTAFSKLTSSQVATPTSVTPEDGFSMTRKHQSKRTAKIRVRRLVFDSLEERRLLAGLDVFVFDDANGSGRFQGDAEAALSGQIVFLDANNDQTFQRGELFARTSSDGVARFNGLTSGDYFPRILGDNNSLRQTSPIGFSDAPVFLPGAGSQLGGWGDSTHVVLVDPRSVRSVDVATNQIEWKHVLQNDIVDFAHGEGSALLIVETETGRELRLLDFESGDLETIGARSDQNWRQPTAFAQGYYVANDDGIYRIANSDAGGYETAKIVDRTIGDTAQIASDRQSRGLVVWDYPSQFEAGPATDSEIRFYDFDDDWTPTASAVRSVGDVPAPFVYEEGRIAIPTSSGVNVLSVGSSFGDLAIIPEASNPLGFDLSRQLVFTQSEQSENAPLSIQAWDMQSWSRAFESELPTANAALHVVSNPTGDIAISTQAGVWVQPIVVNDEFRVSVSSNSRRSRVAIGLQSIGENQLPVRSDEITATVDEDAFLQLENQYFASQFADADGDQLFFFLVDPPEHGAIDLSPTGEGHFLANPNFEGLQSFKIQAFDGRAWSDPFEVFIEVLGVNDPPTGIDVDLAPIPENASEELAFGEIQVLDPDADANYVITVNDPRFVVSEGQLILNNPAAINFETEPEIDLEVLAIDQVNNDRTTRTLRLAIVDTNDAPTDIDLQNLAIAENLVGGTVGVIHVEDEDQNDQHLWAVDDSRFEVSDGELRLKSDAMLNFEATPSIAVTISVTDQNGQGEGISREYVIQVLDQNDPAVGIIVDGGSVSEAIRGARVGRIAVLDEDQGEIYDFQVSDQRFVVEDGYLKLRDDVHLDLSTDADQIDVDIVATSQQSGETIEQAFQFEVTPHTSPWQNPIDPMDVDGDGNVTPRDPLIIINHINHSGMHILVGSPDPEGEGGGVFIDVNGDGRVSAIDALLVIHQINRSRSGAGGEGSGDSDGDAGSGNNSGSAGNAGGEGEGSDFGFARHDDTRSSRLIAEDSLRRQRLQQDLSLAAYLAEQVAQRRGVGPFRQQ